IAPSQPVLLSDGATQGQEHPSTPTQAENRLNETASPGSCIMRGLLLPLVANNPSCDECPRTNRASSLSPWLRYPSRNPPHLTGGLTHGLARKPFVRNNLDHQLVSCLRPP